MVKERTGFEGKDFALQILSVGSFVDDKSCEGKLFQVEATTVRLNQTALSAYGLAQMSNSRHCYETYEEWEAYREKKTLQMDEWKKNVLSALGMGSDLKGVTIRQVQSEVFTIVRISKIKQADSQRPVR